jgi:hypothetical protein
MGTPERKSNNIDINSLKPLPERREAGWGVKQQTSERVLRSLPRKPTEQRDQPSSNPQGQQQVEQAAKKQSEPEYPQERIEELRKILPELTTEQIIYRLKDEDQRAEDKKRGRRRGFGFF